jgi:hypothetical protein
MIEPGRAGWLISHYSGIIGPDVNLLRTFVLLPQLWPYLFSRHQSSVWLCSVSTVIVSITVILYKGTAQFSVCGWRHMLHQIEMCKFVSRIYAFPLPLLRVNLNWHVSFNVLKMVHYYLHLQGKYTYEIRHFLRVRPCYPAAISVVRSFSDTPLSGSSPVRFVKRHHCPATSYVVQLILWHTTVMQLYCCPVLSVTPLSGNQSCCPIHLVTHHCPSTIPARFIHWHTTVLQLSCCLVH